MLLDHGHPEARDYPLGMVNSECNFVNERINARIVTESKLIQMAIGAALSKEGTKLFNEVTAKMHIEVVPRDTLSRE